MNRQQCKQLADSKSMEANALVADIYAGFNSQLGSSQIQIDLGVFKPGDIDKKIGFRFEGKKAIPNRVKPSCSCTPNWEIKKKVDEDLGDFYIFLSNLTVDSREKCEQDQGVKNGAKKIGRSFTLIVLFEQTENENFILSDDGYAVENPMAITATITLTYVIDLS